MEQAQRVEPPRRPELLHHPHELGGAEAELAPLAGGVGPAAGARRGELDAHAGVRHDIHLLGHLEQGIDLRDLLDDDEDLVAELLPHEGQPDELLVLVAVADDEVVGPVGEREDRLQLRLAPHLQPHSMWPAEVQDFLHHMPLLVHLDRVDQRVLAVVLGLLDGDGEALRQALDTGAQDVGEAEQERQSHPLRLQVLRQLVQVERALRFVGRVHGDAPRLVDAEEADTPPLHVVEVERVLDCPIAGDDRLCRLVQVRMPRVVVSRTEPAKSIPRGRPPERPPRPPGGCLLPHSLPA
jgi:hypothetical protein